MRLNGQMQGDSSVGMPGTTSHNEAMEVKSGTRMKGQMGSDSEKSDRVMDSMSMNKVCLKGECS